MIALIVVMALSVLSALTGTISNTPVTRSQMNTRRRQDMARVLASFTEYASNNSGKMPMTDTELDKFVSLYVVGDSHYVRNSGVCDDQFCDPDGMAYKLYAPTLITEDTVNALGNNPSFATQNHEIHYYLQARCGDESGSLIKADTNRDVAVMYVLDGDSVYCGDNY